MHTALPCPIDKKGIETVLIKCNLHTIQTAGGEESSSFISQVTVQRAAQPQNINSFLLRTVKEVVLDGPGD